MVRLLCILNKLSALRITDLHGQAGLTSQQPTFRRNYHDVSDNRRMHRRLESTKPPSNTPTVASIAAMAIRAFMSWGRPNYLAAAVHYSLQAQRRRPHLSPSEPVQREPSFDRSGPWRKVRIMPIAMTATAG